MMHYSKYIKNTELEEFIKDKLLLWQENSFQVYISEFTLLVWKKQKMFMEINNGTQLQSVLLLQGKLYIKST